MFDSMQDWLIIAVVAGVLFYGSTKIPALARSLGRSVGEFKRGRLEIDKELERDKTKTAATESAAAPSSHAPP